MADLPDRGRREEVARRVKAQTHTFPARITTIRTLVDFEFAYRTGMCKQIGQSGGGNAIIGARDQVILLGERRRGRPI